MDIELLRYRSAIMHNIRTFFNTRNYLEADTPALSIHLIPESCLEVFKTCYIEPGTHKKRDLYLVPSPEVYIKQLIAKHKISLFQLSKCYRNVESVGNTHSPEFTMLEYYTMNADYKDSMRITEDLFSFLSRQFTTPFLRISMNQAFEQLAGFTLLNKSATELYEHAKKMGLEPQINNQNTSKNWDDLYQLIFVHCVEPRLSELTTPHGAPLFLTDYPAQTQCLAQNADLNTKERWELYANGIELANCYSEETNAQNVKTYFEQENKLKQNMLIPHKTDSNYYTHFIDFPRCSGVALGVDRLLMVLCGKKSIDSVLPFPLY